jgi:ubiquinone/menaquinone biosynthesis C-methylase UbiE
MINSQVQEKYYNKGWFGRHPEIYTRTDFFMKLIRSKAAQKLCLDHSQRILDIATGTGSQGFEFVKLGHTVVGIDLDIEMLKKAKKKNKGGLRFLFIHGDGTNLCLLSKTFDVAVISFAMHDVPYSIGIKILSEAKRIIKDFGTIYIVDYEEPRHNFIAKILHYVALIYESPNYKPFIRRGLEGYLKPTGLALSKKENIVFGALQLVSLKKAI